MRSTPLLTGTTFWSFVGEFSPYQPFNFRRVIIRFEMTWDVEEAVSDVLQAARGLFGLATIAIVGFVTWMIHSGGNFFRSHHPCLGALCHNCWTPTSMSDLKSKSLRKSEALMIANKTMWTHGMKREHRVFRWVVISVTFTHHQLRHRFPSSLHVPDRSLFSVTVLGH